MNKSFKFLLVAVIAIVTVLSVAKVTLANPSFLGIQTSTAPATSTVSQIVPGSATTTLVFDSYSSGQQYIADTVSFLIQTTASSSAAVTDIRFQFSQDNVDWYDYNPFLVTATTTQQIQNPFTYEVRALGTTRDNDLLTIPMPTRYARAVITATGTSSAVWASFIAKKQVGNNQ